jgi:hypothetical protein
LQLNQVEDAAVQLLAGAKPAVEYNNLRGAGGFIEATAYLAAKLGRLEQATQLLGAAMRIREQTDISMFSFWNVQHRWALETAQHGLGREAFELNMSSGRDMRNEDAINKAIGIMQQVATGVMVG